MAGDALPQPASIPPVRFTREDANRAHDEWGANCGPAALALVSGLTLEEVRPHLGDFEKKGYTNPTLMFDSLRRIGVRWTEKKSDHTALQWPRFGLARIQWEGPWTAPGVPIRVRYRHTHWVAASSQGADWTVPGWEEPRIFDINCICVGGWVSLSEWSGSVVPWLLKECEPKGNGLWHLTHVIEVARPVIGLRESTDPLSMPAALNTERSESSSTVSTHKRGRRD